MIFSIWNYYYHAIIFLSVLSNTVYIFDNRLISLTETFIMYFNYLFLNNLNTINICHMYLCISRILIGKQFLFKYLFNWITGFPFHLKITGHCNVVYKHNLYRLSLWFMLLLPKSLCGFKFQISYSDLQ